MSEEIEKVIKLLGVINKNKFHLHIDTNLEDRLEFSLYQKLQRFDEYISFENTAILSTRAGDTIEDLIKYLKMHNGIEIII